MPPNIPTPGIVAARVMLRDVRNFFVSLKLTLVLLGLSMVLIFVATLDQVNLGIWAVQEKYFRAFVVYTHVGRFSLPVFPGGYTLGTLLLLNLVVSHLYRFAFTWRKAGIQLVHFGLIVLLVGELLTGLSQEDAHLALNQGETKNYAESFRDFELVLIDRSDPAFDQVVAILGFVDREDEAGGHVDVGLDHASLLGGVDGRRHLDPGLLQQSGRTVNGHELWHVANSDSHGNSSRLAREARN
jgi:hypothetical protein